MDESGYSVFVTYVPEHENASGKKVDAMFRVVVHVVCPHCGKEAENRFGVFEPYVNRVRDGNLPEARGIRLKENPDWKKDGRGSR